MRISLAVALVWMGHAATATTWPKVSILTPTCLDRHFMHETLYQVFESQTYKGDIELLISDGECKRASGDKLKPSKFLVTVAEKDKRVKYFFDESPVAKKIGEKRTALLEKATGELIAHMDDDDYYSPTYLETMVQELMDAKADVVKLNAWPNYGEMRVAKGKRKRALTLIDYSKSYMKYGFGFSMVFKKEVVEKLPYLVQDFRDDMDWLGEVQHKFKIHFFAPKQPCLVLRVICDSVHRFAGMPDPKHLAGGILQVTEDPDEWLETNCKGVDLEAWIEKVDYVDSKREEDALAEFAASQSGGATQVDAKGKAVKKPKKPEHKKPKHDEL